jgi:hypothetical protein
MSIWPQRAIACDTDGATGYESADYNQSCYEFGLLH